MIIKNICTRAVLMAALMPTFLPLSVCGSDSDNSGDINTGAGITLSSKNFDFKPEGGQATLSLKTPGEWDAVTSESWIRISKSKQLLTEGSVTIDIDNNSSTSPRDGKITILSGRTSAEVKISQEGRVPAPADPTIKVPDGYELVWNDEFTGDRLNTGDWTHEVQNSGWVNNELQNYVNGSFDGKPVTEVGNGTLKINCFKAGNGKIYSGRIYAKVSTGWKYGIFEARIKLPKGKGTWPAFWMMPVNNDFAANPWPKCGEIDIMEEVGYHPEYTSSSIHCEAYNHTINTQKTAERLTAGSQEDFHVYRLEWTEEYIRTYVDDKLLLNFPNDGKKNVSTWPFTRAFYPILNLAWGGSWGGAQGVDEKCLPATMEVDYVRVFQKKQ